MERQRRQQRELEEKLAEMRIGVATGLNEVTGLATSEYIIMRNMEQIKEPYWRIQSRSMFNLEFISTYRYPLGSQVEIN